MLSAMPCRDMNVAVAGVGNWGQNLVRTFDELASVPLCCHTGTEEHAAWLESNYPETDLTTDYEAVLTDDRVDAVAVATPIPTLNRLARRAVEAGKPVYVEKPMAETREGAKDLASLADRRDTVVFVGYIFVHHPLFTRARTYRSPDDVDHVRLDWQTEGSFGSGIVTNLACHPVSVAVSLSGRPESVDVTGTRSVTGDVDVVELELEYPEFTCEVRVDRVSPTKGYHMDVFTDDRDLCVATDDAFYTFDRTDEVFEQGPEMETDPLTTECSAFLERVESGSRPVTDADFAVDVNSVLDEIQAQIRGE